MVVPQVLPTWSEFEMIFFYEIKYFISLGPIEILVFVVIHHFQHLLVNIIVVHAEKHFVQLVRIWIFLIEIIHFWYRFIEIKSFTWIWYWRWSSSVWLMLWSFNNVSFFIQFPTKTFVLQKWECQSSNSNNNSNHSDNQTNRKKSSWTWWGRCSSISYISISKWSWRKRASKEITYSTICYVKYSISSYTTWFGTNRWSGIRNNL